MSVIVPLGDPRLRLTSAKVAHDDSQPMLRGNKQAHAT
jgi:hypothetical protein